MQIRWTLSVVLAVTFSSGTVAQAKLYQDVIRGFELFGYRFSGQRNLLGDGWDVSAVADWRGGQAFNLGFADLTLDGTILATGGYTLRGIPEGHFTLSTAGAPLSYDIDLNTGFPDISLAGSVLINIDTDINVLGFYDQTFQISNRGALETDGFDLIDVSTLDYDIGPIDISGNIYADALAAITQPFFEVTGCENPFAQFSTRATRVASLTETADELRARVAAGEILSDEELATLVNNSILLGMLEPNPPSSLLDGLLLPDDLLDGGTISPEINAYLENGRAPEPTTLTLLALAMAGLRPQRRRVR